MLSALALSQSLTGASKKPGAPCGVAWLFCVAGPNGKMGWFGPPRSSVGVSLSTIPAAVVPVKSFAFLLLTVGLTWPNGLESLSELRA